MFEMIKTVLANGHKSKTVMFGAALTVLGYLQAHTDLVGLVFQSHAGLAMSVIGVAVIVLRALTDQPLGDK